MVKPIFAAELSGRLICLATIAGREQSSAAIHARIFASPVQSITNYPTGFRQMSKPEFPPRICDFKSI